MAKTVTPRPMPVTSLPDRAEPNWPPCEMKAGISSTGLTINPGSSTKAQKPAGGSKGK